MLVVMGEPAVQCREVFSFIPSSGTVQFRPAALALAVEGHRGEGHDEEQMSRKVI